MNLNNFFWKTHFVLKYKMWNHNIGSKTYIINPIEINSIKNVFIGNNTIINNNAWILSFGNNGTSLKMGNNIRIGHYFHVVAKNSIIIRDNVLIADRVFISDCSHQYRDIHLPIINQKIIDLDKIIIDEGCWIGENVCILGASIGKNTVIGANSVVTHDIPDYCVAVGNPARIIKKYNFTNNQWESYNE